MKIQDLIEAVVKAGSPVVATYLGSPIAGIAVQYLISHFGLQSNSELKDVANAIQNDPERLKSVDYAHIERMAQLVEGLIDKIDSRQSSWLSAILTIILTFGLMLYIAYDFFSVVN